MAPASARAARTMRHSISDRSASARAGGGQPGGNRCPAARSAASASLRPAATSGRHCARSRAASSLVASRNARPRARSACSTTCSGSGAGRLPIGAKAAACARRFAEHRDLQRIDHFARFDQYVPAPTSVGRPSLVRCGDQPDPCVVSDKQHAAFGLECGHRERAGSGEPQRVSCYREHEGHLANAYLQQPPDDVGEGELDRDSANVRHPRDQVHAVAAVDVDRQSGQPVTTWPSLPASIAVSAASVSTRFA